MGRIFLSIPSLHDGAFPFSLIANYGGLRIFCICRPTCIHYVRVCSWQFPLLVAQQVSQRDAPPVGGFGIRFFIKVRRLCFAFVSGAPLTVTLGFWGNQLNFGWRLSALIVWSFLGLFRFLLSTACLALLGVRWFCLCFCLVTWFSSVAVKQMGGLFSKARFGCLPWLCSF